MLLDVTVAVVHGRSSVVDGTMIIGLGNIPSIFHVISFQVICVFIAQWAVCKLDSFGGRPALPAVSWLSGFNAGFPYPSITKSAVLTPVPCSLNVSAGRSSQRLAKGFSCSLCLGPLAQIATRRPPGFSMVKAWVMCLMSVPFSKGGFIRISVKHALKVAVTSKKSSHLTRAL